MPEKWLQSLLFDVSATNLAGATGWKPILLWSLAYQAGSVTGHPCGLVLAPSAATRWSVK
jgi:hypothetical protein